MMYILSEDEMEAVRRERAAAEKMPAYEALENVCKYVATTLVNPQSKSRATNATTDPYGCIHVSDPRGRQWQQQYCDHCPVAGICPLPKDWSK
jgi:hypothetical protein